MNDTRLAELREIYKDRDILEELSWAIYGDHSGYVTKKDGEFINWLCDRAYGEIKASKETLNKIIDEINNLDAPKKDTEYQDGFYDCERMVLDLIDIFLRRPEHAKIRDL